jgi:hypothetical protein
LRLQWQLNNARRLGHSASPGGAEIAKDNQDMLQRIALAFLLTAFPLSVHAVTGQDLLNYCAEFVRKQGTRESLDGLNTGFCIGFMHGVLDATDLTRANGSTPAFCFPQNAKIDQAIRIVEKHLRENPAMLHYSAASQVNLALSRTFPCR